VSRPTFSAVVPAFQAEQTLRSAVRSILDQTRPDFELVIVDDGSTDGTSAIAAELEAADSRIRVVRQDNMGLAAARNTGIANSSAPLVSFLDSDDLWMPTFLEEMGAALDQNPGAAFAYTDGWVLDADSKRIRRTTVMDRQRPPVPPPADPDAFLGEMVKRNFIPAEGTVRRSALERFGAFRPELPAVEDYELWLRLLAHDCPGVRTRSLLLVRREVSTSMSKDMTLMFSAHVEVLRILVEEQPAPEEVKRAARKRIGVLEEDLAMLDGRRPLRSAMVACRTALGRVRNRLRPGGLWYQEPPAEVAAAFPDLAER
jgi:glycosyltransferase involved in cell wall biosynthesis